MQTAAFPPGEVGRPTSRDYWIVGTIMALLHLALLAIDATGDAGFMRADRATQRFGTMRALLESTGSWDTFVQTLTRQGNIGDYGVHALLYGLGGHLAVTVFQTLLAVPSVLCVIYIAARIARSRKIAVAAGLLYGLLPQSLAFPHQLLSEALSNPLAIFGTAAFLRALGMRNRVGNRWLPWVLSGVLLGLAGMARPALILLPMIAGVLLVLFDRESGRWRQAAIVVVAGLIPFVSWGTFMLTHSGKFGFGDSHQDLGINFSQSAGKVLLMNGQAQPNGDPPEWLPERISLSRYFEFMEQYPAGFANLYFKNTLVLITDSGIGRLYVDLLGFGAEARLKLQDSLTGWRAQLTNHGPIAMLKYGMEVAPGTIIAGVVGGLGFAIVNLGLLIGYVRLLFTRTPLWNPAAAIEERWGVAFLLVVPLYVLATSQVVAYAPSRLRSQGEFAWAILACVGWAVAFAWWRRRGKSDARAAVVTA